MIQTNSGSCRIQQGDLFRDIEYIEYLEEKEGIIEGSKIIFPLVIVLTQDCDLEQDYHSRIMGPDEKNQDKWLISVLVAPLYNVEHVYRGEHLKELGLTMQEIKKSNTAVNYLKTNQNPRYHYLEFPKTIEIVPSVIDFKHYFSVNINYLFSIKETNFICSVSSLFREQISQRFSSFLSRIGVQENN